MKQLKLSKKHESKPVIPPPLEGLWAHFDFGVAPRALPLLGRDIPDARRAVATRAGVLTEHVCASPATFAQPLHPRRHSPKVSFFIVCSSGGAAAVDAQLLLVAVGVTNALPLLLRIVTDHPAVVRERSERFPRVRADRHLSLLLLQLCGDSGAINSSSVVTLSPQLQLCELRKAHSALVLLHDTIVFLDDGPCLLGLQRHFRPS